MNKRVVMVVQGVFLFLLVAVPPVVGARMFRNKSDQGQSDAWMVALVAAVFLAPLVTGFFVGRKRPSRVFLTSVLSTTLATILILGMAALRLVRRGSDIPLLTFVIYLQVTVSMTMVGTFLALRRPTTS